MLKTLKKAIYNPIRNRVKRGKEFIAYLYFLSQNTIAHYVIPNPDRKPNIPKKRLLFVGSGQSALEHKKHKLSEVKILTVNNSIKAFDQRVDFYLCSTDFPKERMPKPTQYLTLVLKPKYFYHVLSHAWYYKFPFRPNVGKTIFLDGLYWAMAKGFDEIYLLGFDHDYNPKRVAKWDGKHIGNEKKLKEMFSGKDEAPDAFYGQNTPDPLRHGKHNLAQMFIDAKHHAETYYGCRILNLSSRKGGIEVFERAESIGKS